MILLLLLMSDTCDFIKVLQEWRDETGKNIMNVLKRIKEAKNFKGEESDALLKAVTEFHREIGKADEKEIDVQWYPLCIANKSKLKKMVEAAEKQKKKEQPLLEKKSSSFLIIYPEELTEGRGPNDERILKFLFKGFVTNF